MGITITGKNVVQECSKTYKDAGAKCKDKQDGKLKVKSVSTVDTSAVGVYTVVYSAKDLSGNKANKKTRTIRVRDTTKPTIAVRGKDHIVHYSQEKFRDPGVKRSDSCDTLKIKVTKSWNKAFNERKLGDYIRTYSIQDASGNKASTQRIYSVVDNKVPVITVTGKDTMTFEASNSALYSDKGATCVDHVDGSLNKAIEVSGDSVNMKVPGTYTVKVQDTTAPVLTLTGNKWVKRESGFKYKDAGATALDNLNGDITKSIVVTGKVNTNKPGKYTLVYSVKDVAGNAATTVQRVIRVVDTLPPVISLTLKGKQIHKSAHTQKGANVQKNPAGSV